jgi:predicted acyl esterase
MTRRRAVVWALSGAIALATVVSALSAAEIEQTTVMVAMRDGTRLATDVYLPADWQEPMPVLLKRTPYNKDTDGVEFAPVACGHGYGVVIQDMRGRFASEDEDHVVFLNDGWTERRDGHDTLKWIAEQRWCNGKVGTFGGSARGISQNMLAVGAPDVLKAQHVGVAFSSMYHQAAYQGGSFRKALVENWLRGNHFHPKSLETFRAHEAYDAFWEELDPESQAQRVNAPGVFVGGWYDIFLQGTINSFVSIHGRGGAKARGNCRLIIGPWAHGTFDELTYPENSDQRPEAGDMGRFFEYWLKEADNGATDDKPVHYYVMGDPEDPDAPGNYWRAADAWPPPSQPLLAYFHDDGRLALEEPAGDDTGLTYRYDPSDPVPTVGGHNMTIPKGPMDQRRVESRPDVLTFTSHVLDAPVEITGRIRAKLYVSSDCPDTDFTVKLCDVYPDGRSMLVTDGIQKAKFRESYREAKLLEEGNVYELKVDLWSTSLVFHRGHRVRVAVSSSNFPRFDPNPNTGEPWTPEGETRVATNTLHVSRRHPSHIILPKYQGP